MICMMVYDLYDLYDLAHVAGLEPLTCMIKDKFSGLDLYYTDPAQHLIAAG